MIRSVVRTSAFVRKEAVEILRQPRLLLVLVLGPFAILGLFAAGFQDEARKYDTLFVAAPGSLFADEIETYASNLGPYVTYAGVVGTEEEGLQQLEDGDVDVVVVTPPDAVETVRAGEQAVLSVWHDQLDPIETTTIVVAARLAADEINRQLLAAVVIQGQEASAPAEAALTEARERAALLQRTAEAGDRARLADEAEELDVLLRRVESEVGGTTGVLRQLDLELTPDGGEPARDEGSVPLLDSIGVARQDARSLRIGRGDPEVLAERAEALEQRLVELQDLLAEFRAVPADVLVRPFRSDAESIAGTGDDVGTFYAPAALVLLLQHLGVTFAALSFVRERQLGITELFRVAPLSAGETLTGKYVSYLFVGAAVAAALVALLVLGLDVPLEGTLGDLAIALGLVLFASLGFGFVISMVARNDTQAVQYSMLLLLAALFFGGFFLAVERLIPAARTLSWALPVTYGIDITQDLMLRGGELHVLQAVRLGALGLGAAAVAWWMLRRRMAVG